MSDYPREGWSPRQSQFLLSRLSAYEKAFFVVRRTRGPFLYDIDNYKYVDFFLQGGEVLLGYKPDVFQRVKNDLSRVFYGGNLSLAHSRLEKRVWEWLEKSGIRVKAFRFFDSVSDAFLFLQEWLNFSTWENRTWSVKLPSGRERGEVVFFEALDENLEPGLFSVSGRPILVENACFCRLSDGLSLLDGWEVALLGGVVGNGAGGAMVISRTLDMPSLCPVRGVLAVAMQRTFETLLEIDGISWPSLPSWIRQRGGVFLLPSWVEPEKLLFSGILTKRVGFFSFAHERAEVKRLVRAVQGQKGPLV
ncbi:MAG: hypothetical protein ACK4HQ_05925 [Brevinematales bacterium]